MSTPETEDLSDEANGSIPPRPPKPTAPKPLYIKEEWLNKRKRKLERESKRANNLKEAEITKIVERIDYRASGEHSDNGEERSDNSSRPNSADVSKENGEQTTHDKYRKPPNFPPPPIPAWRNSSPTKETETEEPEQEELKQEEPKQEEPKQSKQPSISNIIPKLTPRSSSSTQAPKTPTPKEKNTVEKAIGIFKSIKGKKKDGEEEITNEERRHEVEERLRKQEQHRKQIEAIKNTANNVTRAAYTPPAKIKNEEKSDKVTVKVYNPSQANDCLQVKKSSEMVPGPDLDKKREYIVKEILSTEKSYVDSLTVAITTYYKPMLEESKVDQHVSVDVVNQIFSKLEVILPLNRDHLLQGLEERVNNWTTTSKIGDVFVRFGPFLKIYTQYSNTYDQSTEALELAAMQPWFLKFCKAKVLIESLLINPIQRIPRYALLLEDLWRNTPEDHPDDESLGTALNLVRKVAEHVNSSMAKHKNFDKLTTEGLEHLLAAHRTLVTDEVLQVIQITDTKIHKEEKVKKDYKFLLFNDIFVFAEAIQLKKKNKDSLEVWPVELLWLKRKNNNRIELMGPCKMITVNCQAPEVQERWWQCLVQVVEKKLENTQTHLKKTDWSGTAVSLELRNGTMRLSNTQVYQGWWLRGNMHGKGIMENMGTVYEGDFDHNTKLGYGTMLFSDGEVYVGEWKANKPNGKGEVTTIQGDRYTGEWKDSKRQGQGELVWVNGDKYVGGWDNDIMSGQGTLALINGTTYIGDWKNGFFNGEGTLTTRQGSYFGNFINGIKSGHGTIKWSNKSVYEGQWKYSLPHGIGKKYDFHGFYDGEWERGVKKGKGKMVYKDGSTYEGRWEDDKRNGYGVFENPGGYVSEYKGDWVKDKKFGKGTIKFSSGNVFEGAMNEDQPHGHGILTCKSRQNIQIQVEGKWVRGVREGKCTATISNLNTNEKTILIIDGENDDTEYILPAYFPVFSSDY